eukprot:540204-Rhodomonas_salina.2
MAHHASGERSWGLATSMADMRRVCSWETTSAVSAGMNGTKHIRNRQCHIQHSDAVRCIVDLL